MSVTYKDIDQLSQKTSVAGTEKLPVSDTEYITPAQINEALVKDTYPVRDSTNPISSNGVLRYCRIASALDYTAEVTGYYMDTTGTAVERSSSSYRTFSVTAGKSYTVCTTFGTTGTTKTRCAAIWLDSNNAVISYEGDYMNLYGTAMRYYDVSFVAPANAVTLVVNFDHGYAIGGVVKESTLDQSISRTSANAVENRTIRENYLYTPIRTVTFTDGARMSSSGSITSAQYFDIASISVTPGNTYSIWTHVYITSGTSNFYLFIWTDANDDVVKYEEYYDVGVSGHKYWYNHLMIAPDGATHLNVNVYKNYRADFMAQRVSTTPYIRAAQVQSDWNESDSASLKYIANKPTNVSAFTNDAGYSQCVLCEDESDIPATPAQNTLYLIEEDGTIIGETTDNKVTSLSASSTNIQYPSAKCVYDALQEVGGVVYTTSDSPSLTDLWDYIESGTPVYLAVEPDQAIKECFRLTRVIINSQETDGAVFTRIAGDAEVTEDYGIESIFYYGSGNWDGVTHVAIPTISTNITTDANSDTKTASPKAVKTYVDNMCGNIETLLAAI